MMGILLFWLGFLCGWGMCLIVWKMALGRR